MVILKTELLHYPTTTQFNIIHKDLKVDIKKLEENELLFTEWLQEQQHLPKKYDEHLVRSFLRMCKNDINKVKSKYENYVRAKTTMPELFQNRCLNQSSFNHKCMAVIPPLTLDCCRVLVIKLPKDAMTADDFNECIKFVFLCTDFSLGNSAEAGQVCIVDCKGFSLSYMKHFSIIRRTIYLVLKVYPNRLKEVHLLNVNTFVNTGINIIKTLLPEKLKQRFRVHRNEEDLLQYLPANCIPKDYGGIAMTTAEISENWRSYFIENRTWIEEQEKLQLVTAAEAL